MADKKILIKNLNGDALFPKTQAAVVYNAKGETLENVEAGAQVNKIETIKVDGVALQIVDKAVEFNIPAQKEYSIVKADTAEEGYASTYQLAADGVAFGTKINIPKDMVISAGELKFAEAVDTPVAGLAVGDPFIELTIANNDGTKINIPVKDLVDVYVAGDSIIVIEDNKISVSLDELGKTFYTKEEIDATVATLATKEALAADKAELEGKIAENTAAIGTANGKIAEIEADIATMATAEAMALKADITYVDTELAKKANKADVEAKEATYDAHIADADIHVTAAKKAEWDAKQGALTEAQVAAVDSTITAEKVAKYDGYETILDGTLTYEEIV